MICVDDMEGADMEGVDMEGFLILKRFNDMRKAPLDKQGGFLISVSNVIQTFL